MSQGLLCQGEFASLFVDPGGEAALVPCSFLLLYDLHGAIAATLDVAGNVAAIVVGGVFHINHELAALVGWY